MNVPINEITTTPATAIDIIGESPVNVFINEVYAYGIVDDAIFEQNETFKNLAEVKSLKADYDGVLIFGITLNPRENNSLPTRGQLADITRAFSRTFKHTPVTIVFKYGNQIALANTERTQFKQTWREGEKVGKVSLLRDIDYTNVHSGHERILNNLAITRSGKNAITNFESLYKYWQEVLSVSILNKEFYKELSVWYFWAIKEVKFPNEPNRFDFDTDEHFDEAVKEHKGKNVIRLLTRILFIWFIKEKGLVPEEIFDEKEIANKFIDGFTPQKPEGMFANGKYSSKYYRAILQNLFFATLNQERNKRQFRIPKSHLNVTQLMRYEDYLKDPKYFIQLMEKTVPFMNGGLFECLDKPHPTIKGPQGGDKIIYIDGFSDRPDNDVMVPDFLFFDADEEVDVSSDFGSTNKIYKSAHTRGLITILKSYKFTITENTPIDEDIALDPELLGKVFENLLASYNPETKTTARKQTGSFYTPREIVNYMVEESLIAYLKNRLLHEEAGIVELGKNQIALFGNETKKSQLSIEVKVDQSPFIGKETELDEMLHQLVSYSDINPFKEYPEVQKKIIQALDNCTILDPACGSGAYPMGILQKMVHILHKIDPNNTEWKQRQIDRVDNAIEQLEHIDDDKFRENAIGELKLQIKDIKASFDNNELDYGRKLYLIENCIYGVDIQPIATQISKLRFFISLVVDQKVDATKEDFGIRPLPNLEAKFVAANTLIGIEKPQKGQFTGSLFDNREVQKQENELKKIRHKLFSIKTPSIKRELREQDKILRKKISDLLAPDFGNDTARLLANWDPYDQNATSPFYDTEWMFGLPNINGGFFDIVIGNPPYVLLQEKIKDLNQLKYFKSNYITAVFKVDLYHLFIEKGLKLLSSNGILSFINPSNFQTNNYTETLRNLILTNYQLSNIVNFEDDVFDASVNTCVIIIKNERPLKNILSFNNANFINGKLDIKLISNQLQENYLKNDSNVLQPIKNDLSNLLIQKFENKGVHIKSIGKVNFGMQLRDRKIFIDDVIETKNKDVLSQYHEPCYTGKNIKRYELNYSNLYCFFNVEAKKGGCWDRQTHSTKNKIIIRQIGAVPIATLDVNGYALLNSAFMITSDILDTKYILALINSKSIEFYWKNKFSDNRKTFPKIKGTYLEKIPLVKASVEIEFKIINLVDQIIINKRINNPTNILEAEIDLIVFKLYELTYSEVKIIDLDFWLNEEEYNAIKI
ncbi:Eco57I restriction-modification methylase domain-containing protein [Flavobacterium yafengii]|uniref:Eco57I restriction-modification methylase domain-containing protein n=1 Tax=Flavobacterium yafengii TaxID=3041253 RepID=UPI0024A9A62D|nr:TaqI-like C-terminal specificity domain-containing protein [Flavobacterium yafengii]